MKSSISDRSDVADQSDWRDGIQFALTHTASRPSERSESFIRRIVNQSGLAVAVGHAHPTYPEVSVRSAQPCGCSTPSRVQRRRAGFRIRRMQRIGRMSVANCATDSFLLFDWARAQYRDQIRNTEARRGALDPKTQFLGLFSSPWLRVSVLLLFSVSPCRCSSPWLRVSVLLLLT